MSGSKAGYGECQQVYRYYAHKLQLKVLCIVTVCHFFRC